jgi:tetratricopeptide (TPR) repeat protein
MPNASSPLAEAITLHRAGRLADAEKIYHSILATRPDDFDSLHLLGVVFLQRGQPAEAIRQLDAALARYPDNASALNNRGNALNALMRFEEAVASYDRALAAEPNYAEAHSNRGATLHRLRRFQEAVASYDRALALQPDYAEAHTNRGNSLHALEQYEEALASHDRALALRPNYAEAHSNRGNALHALTRYEEALASYDRALALRPEYPEAYCNRANALQALKRFAEALASCERAIALRPNNAEAYSNRGNALQELRRFPEALASHDCALAMRPDYAEAHYNRGNVLMELKRFEDALASFERALALRPDYAEALLTRGNALQELGRCGEASASYERALAVRPDYADAHFNAALCRLLVGDFKRGCEEYEWRWETAPGKIGKRNFSQRLWTGCEEIAGRTILLHAEQGFGDTIQFCRYVPLVAKRANRVILEVQEPLLTLMATLAGAAQIVSRDDPLPDFDVHCPLLSLPLAFGTELASIPGDTPYLSAPVDRTEAWHARLGQHEKRRIGLVWAGNPRKQLADARRIDGERSIAFDSLAPILHVAGCEFYSLQKGGDAVAQLHDSTLCRQIIDVTDDLHDFSDTAALIENLDLVISVDTVVAHLAGALGKPFWLINRYNTCWRWLLDREDSPWYPTARLFRQDSTRDWDSVIGRVQAALHEFVRA